MSAVTQQPYSFRPLTLVDGESDIPFLRELYASTRQDEMALTGWPQQQIDAFLLQQFEAQHSFYMQQFTSADFDVILNADNTPIGRLYLDERDDEFRIIDIALLPQHRGKGIGGKIMQDIIDRAFGAKKPLTIHVESNNPAMRLYHRLGFKKIEDQGVYHLMKLDPPARDEDCAA